MKRQAPTFTHIVVRTTGDGVNRAVFARPGHLVMVEDHTVVAETAGGKTFTYYPHADSITFSSTPTGIRARRSTDAGRKRKYFGQYVNVALDAFERRVNDQSVIDVGFTEAFGSTVDGLMPLRTQVPILAKDYGAPSWLVGAPDIATAVRRAFGTTRYRKDLVKAVAQVGSWPAFAFAVDARGVVPTDWLIGFLRSASHENLQPELRYPYYTSTPLAVGSARALAVRGGPKIVRKLLNLDDPTSPFRSDAFLSIAHDAMRMASDGILLPDPAAVRGWRSLHDALADNQRSLKKISKPIPQSKTAQAVDGATDGRVTIVTAKATGDLDRWAVEMNHCIDGYAPEALAGSSVLFGVHVDGKLVGNGQLVRRGKSWQLVQLRGWSNARVSPDISAAVDTLLDGAGVAA